jgi:hypothetical protein
MPRRAWAGMFLLLSGGCLPGPSGNTLVPCNPFITQAFKPAEVRHDVESPGTRESAERVAAVGAKIIAANPQLGFRPHFNTTGSAKEEIYHRGLRDVFITEGLARRCGTDAELAAVLCLELGKMVAEREAFAEPLTRVKRESLPIDLPVGNDSGGLFGSPDGTRRMELSKYVEQARHQADAPPPSPEALAREYMRKAGFASAEVGAAAPAPRPVDRQAALERMLTIEW